MTTTRRQSSAAEACPVTADIREQSTGRRVSARLVEKSGPAAGNGKSANAKKSGEASDSKARKGSKRAREHESPQAVEEAQKKRQRGRPRKSATAMKTPPQQTSPRPTASGKLLPQEDSPKPEAEPQKKRSRRTACGPQALAATVAAPVCEPAAVRLVASRRSPPPGAAEIVAASVGPALNTGQAVAAPMPITNPPTIRSHEQEAHCAAVGSTKPIVVAGTAAGQASDLETVPCSLQLQPPLGAFTQHERSGDVTAPTAAASAEAAGAAVAIAAAVVVAAAGSPRAAVSLRPAAGGREASTVLAEPVDKPSGQSAAAAPIQPNGALSDDEIRKIRNLLMPGALIVNASCVPVTEAATNGVSDTAAVSIIATGGGTTNAGDVGNVAKPTCRVSQFKELYDMVSDCCSTGRSSAAYISGLPGTGKTYTLSRILAALPEIASFSGKCNSVVPFCCVSVNCMALDDPVQLYGRLQDELIRAMAIGNGLEHDMPDTTPTPTDARAAYESLRTTLSKLSIIRSPTATGTAKGTKGTAKKGSKRRHCRAGADPSTEPGDDAAGSRAAATSRRVIVVVLDEVDRLLRRRDGGEEMARLFQLPTTSGLSMVLLAVANSLDLTERLLPMLKGQCASMTLKHLVFTAYSRPQVLAILSAQLEAHPRGRRCFDDAALDMVAKSVSSSCGDIRQALKACRIALDVLMEHNRTNSAAARASVGIREVHAALQRLSSQNNGQSAMMAKIKGLPPQQQLVLLALATAVGAKAAAAGADHCAGNCTATFQPGSTLFTGSRPKFADAVAFREIGNVAGASQPAASNPGACFDGPTPSKPPRPGAPAAGTPSTSRVIGVMGPGGGALTPSSCSRGPASRTPASFMAGDAGLALGLAEVYSQYGTLCKQMDIPAMSEASFRMEALRGLACDGMLRMVEGRTPAAMRLSLRVMVRDVQAALADNVMFKRLMGSKAPPTGAAVAGTAPMPAIRA